MDEASLEEAILLALRRSPRTHADGLAQAVGLPRTNFGRQLKHGLGRPLKHLVAQGLVDEDHGRFQLTESAEGD